MRAYAAIATSDGATGEEGRAGEVVAEGVWQEGERGDGIGDAEVGTEADGDGAGGPCPTSGSRSSYVSQSSPSGDSYDAGYDAGFEDGYAAGVANNSFGVGYDDANEFSDEDATRFCAGYEAGYESGFSEGLAHYNDEKQKESLRTRSFFHHNHYPDPWDEE